MDSVIAALPDVILWILKGVGIALGAAFAIRILCFLVELALLLPTILVHLAGLAVLLPELAIRLGTLPLLLPKLALNLLRLVPALPGIVLGLVGLVISLPTVALALLGVVVLLVRAPFRLASEESPLAVHLWRVWSGLRRNPLTRGLRAVRRRLTRNALTRRLDAFGRRLGDNGLTRALDRVRGRLVDTGFTRALRRRRRRLIESRLAKQVGVPRRAFAPMRGAYREGMNRALGAAFGVLLPAFKWLAIVALAAGVVFVAWKAPMLLVALVLSWLITWKLIPWLYVRIARGLGFRAKMTPITLRRVARFKRIKRGYVSFMAITTLFVMSLFLEMLVNDKALVIRYGDRIAFPAVNEWLDKVLFFTRVASFERARDFGQEGDGPVDYRLFEKHSEDPSALRAELDEARAQLEKDRAAFEAKGPPAPNARKHVWKRYERAQRKLEKRMAEYELAHRLDASGERIPVLEPDYERDAMGDFVLDADGEKKPLYERDANGAFVLDENGGKKPALVQAYERDAKGEFVLDLIGEKKPLFELVYETDENGELVLDENGRKKPVRELVGGILWLEARYQVFAEGDAWCLMPIYPYSTRVRSDLAENPPNRPSPAQGIPLGTDTAGRDVLVLLAYGFRISLFFAMLVAIIGYTIGVIVGGIQGYFGGWVDIVSQRVVEIWGSIPFLLTILIIGSLMERTLGLLIGMLVIFRSWLGITYYVRGEFYREKGKDYVQAAIGAGVSDWKIITKHILPNSLVPVVTFAPFGIVSYVVILVSLDYLGFGLPPGTPSWGSLLKQGLENVRFYPHLAIVPTVALGLTLFCVVMVGEAVREAFDPKVFSRLR